MAAYWSPVCVCALSMMTIYHLPSLWLTYKHTHAHTQSELAKSDRV